MRTKGKISFWDDDKGYGFIEPYAGGERVFIHIKAFSNPSRRPAKNQLVTFALSADKRGRPCAVKATLAGDRLPDKTRKNNSSASIIGAVLFIAIVVSLVLTANIPLSVLVLYLVASLVTFITYAIDKSAAKSGAWRTQESTLHLLSLVGGWPGAIAAQQTLRHKSKKQSFQIVFWITVLANCAAFSWLLTTTGSAMYQSIVTNIF